MQDCSLHYRIKPSAPKHKRASSWHLKTNSKCHISRWTKWRSLKWQMVRGKTVQLGTPIMSRQSQILFRALRLSRWGIVCPVKQNTISTSKLLDRLSVVQGRKLTYLYGIWLLFTIRIRRGRKTLKNLQWENSSNKSSSYTTKARWTLNNRLKTRRCWLRIEIWSRWGSTMITWTVIQMSSSNKSVTYWLISARKIRNSKMTSRNCVIAHKPSLTSQSLIRTITRVWITEAPRMLSRHHCFIARSTILVSRVLWKPRTTSPHPR
jgi:hypothetical protein